MGYETRDQKPVTRDSLLPDSYTILNLNLGFDRALLCQNLKQYHDARQTVFFHRVCLEQIYVGPKGPLQVEKHSSKMIKVVFREAIFSFISFLEKSAKWF
jgi:hypothetical protein